MKNKSLFFALPFLAVIAGCNPSGTCIYGDEKAESGALCALDYPKKACESTTNGTFFKEEKTAGVLRCKSQGFEFSKGGGENLLFKRPKK